jgi:hypothetical protein
MKKLVFLVVVCCVFAACKKVKKLEEIYNETGYAIGKITKSTNIAYVLTYYYEYQVANITYKGEKNGGVTNNDDSRMMGRRFLVVYKQSEPKKSDLNFKYPIETEQDFLDM